MADTASNQNTSFGANPSSFAGTNTSFAGIDVAVSWKDLRYTIEKKEILKGLTGSALPRRSLAIMGSSGAGKTTLMNAIADRLATDDTKVLEGARLLNEVTFASAYKRAFGFVPQDDIINPMSTPTEALSFSLRIRRGCTAEETETKVNAMLEELNLVEAKDTIVGIPGIMAGLSGGERKRTSIGVELVAQPKVLLLDEPTSGLDSTTSVHVLRLLRNLARRGRTVLFTIHQPPADGLEFFDDFLLMAAGETVFHGPFSEATSYFAAQGHVCPDAYSPTDYFMTLVQDPDLAPGLIEAWKTHAADPANQTDHLLAPAPAYTGIVEPTKDVLEKVSAAGSSLGVQAVELFRRSFKSVMRNKMYIGSTFVQAIVFGTIMALIFMNLTKDQTGVADRNGLLFVVGTNLAFSSVMTVVNTFAPDKAVYIREQQGGSYSPVLYFFAKSLSELPIQALAAMATAIIVYWSADFVPTAESFFLFYAITLMMQQTGAGIGLAASSLIDNYVLLTGVVPMLILPMMMVAGFMASTDRVRPYWIWLEKISFVRHGFILLAKNEYSNLGNITCEFGQEFCARQPKNGKEVLTALDLDSPQDDVWVMWMSITIIFLLSRLVAIAGLTRIASRKN